ncbi:hypothetical protein LPPLD21_01092 [Lactiplantibacillus paraplantarum]|uniref:Uncharacterized protein n=1 Tax=Lactiplantibacillus paraplantarum TaxID=60520 RepID=A0ABQ0N935_9LACO|nr:hypothetical protein LPPLD21_01092 [Lactiplantibacillus paraplantarum]
MINVIAMNQHGTETNMNEDDYFDKSHCVI